MVITGISSLWALNLSAGQTVCAEGEWVSYPPQTREPQSGFVSLDRDHTYATFPDTNFSPPLGTATAVRLLQPPAAKPRPALEALFPESPAGAEIAAIGRFLDDSSPTRGGALPPSLARLREMRKRLLGKDFGGAGSGDVVALDARDHYVGRIDALLKGPSDEELLRAVQGLLNLSTAALHVYLSVSPLAQAGLYALAAALSPGRRQNLVAFLTSRTIETFRGVSVEAILETAALLADRRVRGFERAFVPKEFKNGRVDEKFLATPLLGGQERIPSLFAEYREALRIAGHTAVVQTAHDEELTVDWKGLTPEEERYLRRYIEPRVNFRFRAQKNTSVDVSYRLSNGRRRIVEVKSSASYLDFNAHKFEIELLQVFRHALLVRRHGLEGVEYVLTAPRVSERLPRRIREILDLTGTNYVLTTRRPHGEAHAVERGMRRLGGDLSLPTERRYPFFL